MIRGMLGTGSGDSNSKWAVVCDFSVSGALNHRCCWFAGAPLRDSKDALSVNWLGV